MLCDKKLFLLLFFWLLFSSFPINNGFNPLNNQPLLNDEKKTSQKVIKNPGLTMLFTLIVFGSFVYFSVKGVEYWWKKKLFSQFQIALEQDCIGGAGEKIDYNSFFGQDISGLISSSKESAKNNFLASKNKKFNNYLYSFLTKNFMQKISFIIEKSLLYYDESYASENQFYGELPMQWEQPSFLLNSYKKSDKKEVSNEILNNEIFNSNKKGISLSDSCISSFKKGNEKRLDPSFYTKLYPSLVNFFITFLIVEYSSIEKIKPIGDDLLIALMELHFHLTKRETRAQLNKRTYLGGALSTLFSSYFNDVNKSNIKWGDYLKKQTSEEEENEANVLKFFTALKRENNFDINIFNNLQQVNLVVKDLQVVKLPFFYRLTHWW